MCSKSTLQLLGKGSLSIKFSAYNLTAVKLKIGARVTFKLRLADGFAIKFWFHLIMPIELQYWVTFNFKLISIV